MPTLTDAARRLAAGTTTARALVEDCLQRIADPGGEGARTFMTVYAEQARASADATDALRRAGRAPGPLAGIPVSLKDLLDVRGERTRAGSVVLDAAPPAAAHAAVVARLLAAGLVPVGRTTMTEFAFSGLGINPHHGTPLSPWDRATGRIPGGSSSGAAVSVADGMALGALGTDTGGSCRVPAALCGVVGYKPTARRVPLGGVLPLSPSLDSVGPLAPTVRCCALLDAVLAGAEADALDAILATDPPVGAAPEGAHGGGSPFGLPYDAPSGARHPGALAAARLDGLRLLVPTNVVLEGLDGPTATAFERALATLERAGARVTRARLAAFDRIGPANAGGGFAAAEAFAWHRGLLERDLMEHDLAAGEATRYDPRVRSRILRGQTQEAADLVILQAARHRICAEADRDTAAFDAVAMPTVPVVPPRLADLAGEAEYNRVNMLLLRNPALGNFLDRCAISLPCHRAGEPPAGLMLMGETMGDARLFAVALGVEAALAG